MSPSTACGLAPSLSRWQPAALPLHSRLALCLASSRHVGRAKRRTETAPFRSQLTPPERRSFEPTPVRASCKTLICLASDIRTKTGVVRLCQRKGPERGEKGPKMGFRAGVRGSDKGPEKPTFCGFPTADQERKRNVPTGETGGGKLTRREHSFRWGALKHYESHDRLTLPCPRASNERSQVVSPLAGVIQQVDMRWG